MPSSITTCTLCGNQVDTADKDTWKLVTGWVGGPRKDSMRLRKDVGLYAHNECVLNSQAGQDPKSQPTLDADVDSIPPQSEPVPDDLFAASEETPEEHERINKAFEFGNLGKTYLQEF